MTEYNSWYKVNMIRKGDGYFYVQASTYEEASTKALEVAIDPYWTGYQIHDVVEQMYVKKKDLPPNAKLEKL